MSEHTIHLSLALTDDPAELVTEIAATVAIGRDYAGEIEISRVGPAIIYAASATRRDGVEVQDRELGPHLLGMVERSVATWRESLEGRRAIDAFMCAEPIARAEAAADRRHDERAAA